MDGDNRVIAIGAVASFLDTCGVGGNLYEKSSKLVTILESLEEKFATHNIGSTKLPQTCDVCRLRNMCSPSVERGENRCLDGLRQLRTVA